MNVLRVIGSMRPSTGGPCQGIRNTIPQLEKLGYHNEVVSLDSPEAAFLGQDSFPIHPMGPAKGPWCYTDKLIPWLLQNLMRFDVVLVHGLWLYHSYAVLKALREYKEQLQASAIALSAPKCFLMPHGMLDPYFQRAPDRRLKAMRNWLYWKLIEEKVVRQADALLFTCEAELLLASESFRPYRPNKVVNVGYGIAPPPPFERSMEQAFLHLCPGLGASPYILFLSRIHQKKGVELLLQAYGSLVEQLEQRGASVPKLVIAGPGLETAYGQGLLQVVADKPQLQSQVFFPGMMSGDAKWGAFYGCEAFILPSHQENFGIAVVEALACGKAVLISDQVNIWHEILASGGGIVEEDTLPGVRQLLERWFRSTAEEKQAMGQNALLTFEQRFKIEPAARQLALAFGNTNSPTSAVGV